MFYQNRTIEPIAEVLDAIGSRRGSRWWRLWLGGFDDVGNLRMAAQTFRDADRSDYGPGPLTSIGITNPETCGDWDKIWMINNNDVIRHRSDFI